MSCECDGPPVRFLQRTQAVMRVINSHAERADTKATGRYRHDLVVTLGRTCIMVNRFSGEGRRCFL